MAETWIDGVEHTPDVNLHHAALVVCGNILVIVDEQHPGVGENGGSCDQYPFC